MSDALPIIRASGVNREIGRQIGEAAREQVRRCVAFHRESYEWLAGISFAAAEPRALALMPYARRTLPQYVEELEGLAEGAGVPFAALAVLNCGEELMCAPAPSGPESAAAVSKANAAVSPTGERQGKGCTDVAIAAGGRTVLGHNEDWIEDDIQNMVLLDVTTATGTRFAALTGAAYLPTCGLNSHRLGFGGNSVYARDERPGVPNAFLQRWKLESTTRGEADARALFPGRARGSNYVGAQAGGLIWDLEVSGERSALLAVETGGGRSGPVDWLVHTNHFLSDELRDVDGSTSRSSRLRLERARELVAAGLAGYDEPLELATRVLSDHANEPLSICAHGVPGETEPAPTTGSVLMELEQGRLRACAGPPCQGQWRVVTIE